MKILFASAFKVPSGYHSLGEGIALGLCELGHEVTVLGKGHDAREHYYPFSLNPTINEFLPEHIRRMVDIVKPDWILSLDDIPKQLAYLNNIFVYHPEIFLHHKIASLFPVESAPLCTKWANGLRNRSTVRFTFSEFGMRVCKEAGLSVHKLPVALNEDWYKPALQQPGIDKPYILAVSANQLRKNIPAILKIAGQVIAKQKQEMKQAIYLVLITDIESADGWDLKDLHFTSECGIYPEDLVIIDRSAVSPAALKTFYANAAVLLHTAIAEGIGLPLYEAQSQGCPVVATNCCAIPEAIQQGELIDVCAETPYPWGNSTQFWPSIEDGVNKTILTMEKQRQSVRFAKPIEVATKIISVLNLFDGVSHVEKEQPELASVN